MDIFDVFSLIGGLALFLYGMHVMGDGLTKTSGGKLEMVLEKLTSNRLSAVALGAGVTAVIQSSSATTVMVVGFVNSGIMKLGQAIGIIMGANIGTTATAWILSLSGIESSNFFVQLCKPSSFSPLLAMIGVVMMLFTKSEKNKSVGSILIGFAVLMTGMSAMSSAVAGLEEVEAFTNLLVAFSNPIFGILAGALLTAIIQSSSASVGILQAFCATGAITFSSAVPIILGQNIGTCVTAMISGVGANKNARRAALVHLYFNIIGTSVFMLAFYGFNYFIGFSFFDDIITSTQIAIVHTVFNVVATFSMLPFAKFLEKLAYLTIKDDEKEEEEQVSHIQEDLNRLDPRFLETPAIAVEQCVGVAAAMANVAKETLFLSMDVIHKYDEKKIARVLELEKRVDRYEDELGTYLIKLSQRQLSEKESHAISILLHSLSDFERISDHGASIVGSVIKMNEKSMTFSSNANNELLVYEEAVKKIVETTQTVFANHDVALARDIEPLEEVIDHLNSRIKKRHVQRLRAASCSIEVGLLLTDICTHFERVADHCSNIAVCLVQVADDSLESHEYLHSIKRHDEYFKEKYNEYKEQFILPQRIVK
ncbi:MAG: Na/Pi cotransporter family protein [Clostridia bacterium]